MPLDDGRRRLAQDAAADTVADPGNDIAVELQIQRDHVAAKGVVHGRGRIGHIQGDGAGGFPRQLHDDLLIDVIWHGSVAAQSNRFADL